MLVGCALAVAPCVTVDKEHSWTTHPPTTLFPAIMGGVLLIVAVIGFVNSIRISERESSPDVDLNKVSENNGILSTKIGSCEISVMEGRIEEYSNTRRGAIALPCNEYFDDRCAHDTRSALGAYVGRHYGNQINEFTELSRAEARRRFGAGKLQQKTDSELAESFGVGRCLLLKNPFGRTETIALISTTTQRAKEGLTAEISCLFEGMHDLTRCLADVTIDEVAMPILGAGHGNISPPLAFIGLVLAVAEAARYGKGAQRLKRVVIIVLKKDDNSPASVNKSTIRHALGLIASQN
jgi:hypothetical protein